MSTPLDDKLRALRSGLVRLDPEALMTFARAAAALGAAEERSVVCEFLAHPDRNSCVQHIAKRVEAGEHIALAAAKRTPGGG
jgi:hypothetical protein